MREKKRDEDADEAEDEDKTDEEKAKQATIAIGSMNAMNAVPTSSPPPTRSNFAQLSAGPSRAKRSAEPHPTTFTSPVDTTLIPNTSTPPPGAVTLRVGCCTCLLFCTGCVSRHRDGHH